MSFQDILGQDSAISFLRASLESGKLAGAYLFTGPEGVGKYLAARAFAKAINCLDKEDDSCDRCPSCVRIDKASHPDVHAIGLTQEEDISIEQIRQLKNKIALRPYEARYKVFLIDNAHLLSADAANALLKILEEPPSHSLIILVSAKPGLLFKTVVSRCQKVMFSALKKENLEGLLKNDYHLDSELAHFLAYFCEGRIGPALKLKEQDILKEKNRIIDIFTLSKTCETDDLARESKREDIRRYLNALCGWFRDIHLLKSGAPYAQLINLDRRQELLKCMDRFSWQELERAFKAISDSFSYLDQNLNLKLLLFNLRMNLWK